MFDSRRPLRPPFADLACDLGESNVWSAADLTVSIPLSDAPADPS